MDYAAEYTRIHEQHPKFFAGMSLKRYVDDLVKIVKEHRPKRLLDYGSGRGYQYLKARYHIRWAPYMCGFDSSMEGDGVEALAGNELPICYDVGVRQLSERPQGKFDGIINTDMMEHIDAPDVPRILDDILSFIDPATAKPFVFFAISCVPDDKPFTLSDGRGVHVTLKDPPWWRAQITASAGRVFKSHPPTIYCVYDCKGGGVREVIE